MMVCFCFSLLLVFVSMLHDFVILIKHFILLQIAMVRQSVKSTLKAKASYHHIKFRVDMTEMAFMHMWGQEVG